MILRMLRQLWPSRSAAHARFAYAVSLVQSRALTAAETELRAVLNEAPGNNDARHLLGSVLSDLGRHPEAIAVLSECVRVAPDVSEIRLHLAAALIAIDEVPAAERELRTALKQPNPSPAIRNALGNLLAGKNCLHEALIEYDFLVTQAPDRAEGWINRGNILRNLCRIDDACLSYQRALALAPDSSDARFNYALALLAAQRWEAGWAHYDARFTQSGAPPEWRSLPFPVWRGEALAGRKILLWREQGLGDEIMFASCIHALLAAGARVVIECSPKLEALFRRSFAAAAVYVQCADRSLPDAARNCDVHAPLGSLPRYLRRSLVDFPRHAGYLQADPLRVAYWQERLAALGPGYKVGISWQGGTLKTRRSVRSIPLREWQPLLRTPGVTFVNLQYTDSQADLAELAALGIQVVDFPEVRDSYDDTAALVCALDQVISVCTAVIHLGGALGKPVWVLAPFSPEWRYGIAGDSMPWYPSVRVFRQLENDTWRDMLAPVAQTLRKTLLDFDRESS